MTILEKRHHHPSSWRVLNGFDPAGDVDRNLDNLFEQIANDGITTCSEACESCLKNGWCSALGIEAPIGDDCAPQKISKEVLR